jgi:hypothetical protein
MACAKMSNLMPNYEKLTLILIKSHMIQQAKNAISFFSPIHMKSFPFKIKKMSEKY